MASIFGQVLANERIPDKAKLENALPLQIPSPLNELPEKIPSRIKEEVGFSSLSKNRFFMKENLSIQKESIFTREGQQRQFDVDTRPQ